VQLWSCQILHFQLLSLTHAPVTAVTNVLLVFNSIYQETETVIAVFSSKLTSNENPGTETTLPSSLLVRVAVISKIFSLFKI